MLIAEVLLTDGNWTLSDCGEAAASESHLFLVSAGKGQGAGLFSAVPPQPGLGPSTSAPADAHRRDDSRISFLIGDWSWR